MDNRLMTYLIGKGMQPSALDRLIQKMEQTRGGQPFKARQGFNGNINALAGKAPQPPMYQGQRNAGI